MTATHNGTDHVELTVPLRTEFAATIRVLAASLGADVGFSIDEIDDFRLGLNEVFVVLADRYPTSRARTTFRIGHDQLAVTMRPDPGDDMVELDELGASILRSVVDTFESGADGITLVKRARESTDG